MGVLDSKLNTDRPTSLFEFTHGIDLDQHVGPYEVQTQKAWVLGLHKAGVITDAEQKQALSGLEEALQLLLSGQFEFKVEDEDIHMNLERFLTERFGQLGKKLHTGRSRNDLIATSLRLMVFAHLEEIKTFTNNLISSLESFAQKSGDVVVPGMTHLQNGQPVLFSHVIRSYKSAFERDNFRLQQAQSAAKDTLPLGAGALAGTDQNIDLELLCHELGFLRVCQNSYDSVGDRDFILDALNAYASMAVHLSRLSEDIIIWASSGFELIKLSPNWSTGSSMMPNKRNPDIAELSRAKSAQVMGAASMAMTLLKGLPTCYASDLHELKRVYLNSFSQMLAMAGVYPSFVNSLEVNASGAEQLRNKGHILATDVASHLVQQGLSFRDAYIKVAELVALAEASQRQIHQLPISGWTTVLGDEMDLGFVDQLDFQTSIQARKQPGGTGSN